MMIVLLVALSVVTAPALAHIDARVHCQDVGGTVPGRYVGFLPVTVRDRCFTFHVNAGDTILVSVKRTGGVAEVVTGALYLPNGPIVNPMQFFSARERDTGWCVALDGGTYTLGIASGNGPIGARYEVTIDTTTSLEGGELNLPPSDLNVPNLVISTVLALLNFGQCRHFD